MSAILDELVALDLRELKSEVDNLRAIKTWALANLGIDYTAGDRVRIVSPEPSSRGDGWACYSEALAVGQTGIAGEITFNRWAKTPHWDVLVGMDRCWSTHERDWGDRQTVRYWRGPAAEVPPGFTVPDGYPPEGRAKWFSMRLSWVTKDAA